MDSWLCDEKKRVIANEDGRVAYPVSRAVIANEYVVGWARTGPQGLIGSHMKVRPLLLTST